MKPILLAIGVSLLAMGSAQARSYPNCLFKMMGESNKSGPCTVETGDELVTISMGSKSYGIMLDDDNSGTFVFMPSMRQIDEVRRKNGRSCWSGANVTFCPEAAN